MRQPYDSRFSRMMSTGQICWRVFWKRRISSIYWNETGSRTVLNWRNCSPCWPLVLVDLPIPKNCPTPSRLMMTMASSSSTSMTSCWVRMWESSAAICICTKGLAVFCLKWLSEFDDKACSNLIGTGFCFIFRTAECTFRSGEYTFRNGERTFRSAEYKLKAACREIHDGWCYTFSCLVLIHWLLPGRQDDFPSPDYLWLA